MKRIILFFTFALLFAFSGNAQIATKTDFVGFRTGDPASCARTGLRYWDTDDLVEKRCMAAGTPGTWTESGGGGGTGTAVGTGGTGVPALVLTQGAANNGTDLLFEYKTSNGTTRVYGYIDGNNSLSFNTTSGQVRWGDNFNTGLNFKTNAFSSTDPTLTVSSIVSTKPSLALQLAGSQTADGFQIFNSGSTKIFSVSAAGGMAVGATSSMYSGSSVASASAIVPTGNVFHLTGTTTVTSITATNVAAGTTITVIFDSTAQMSDGNNLVLAGNFTGAANRTITLVYDGTNFYEVARSTN